MEISVPSFTQTKPVQFTIHVSLPNHTSYILKKRYSEFATFHSELLEEVGHDQTMLSSVFPGKKWSLFGGNTNEEFLKERRRGLELFLRNVVKNEELRECLAVIRFLELSKHVREQGRSIEATLQNASEWAKAVNVVRSKLQQLKSLKSSQSRDGEAVEDSVEERKLKVGIKSGLTELESSLVGNVGGMGQGEYMRRRNIVQDLSNTLNQIETSKKNSGNGRDEDASYRPFSTSHSSNLSPLESKSKGVSNLFSSCNNNRSNSNKRVLGATEETDKTRQQNNAGLLELYQTEMQAQDQIIDSLHSTLINQKNLGQQIYHEIEFQNQLLDDLDSDVHKTNTRLNQARRNVKRFQ